MTPRHFSSDSSAPGEGASLRVRRAGEIVLILCAVLLGAAVTRHTGAATTPFVAVDLGTLGGDFSFAYDVNDRGQVVGDSFTTGNAADHAFSWTPAGGMTDRGTLGGTRSVARAMNAHGQVVGSSYTAGNAALHAFSWTRAGGMIDLGTLGGDVSIAYAVNARGQVVGDSLTTGDIADHAF